LSKILNGKYGQKGKPDKIMLQVLLIVFDNLASNSTRKV